MILQSLYSVFYCLELWILRFIPWWWPHDIETWYLIISILNLCLHAFQGEITLTESGDVKFGLIKKSDGLKVRQVTPVASSTPKGSSSVKIFICLICNWIIYKLCLMIVQNLLLFIQKLLHFKYMFTVQCSYMFTIYSLYFLLALDEILQLECYSYSNAWQHILSGFN